MNKLDSRRLAAAESVAMLRDSLTDGHPDHASGGATETTAAAASSVPSRLTVAVALRRGRIAGTTLFAIAILLALTELFRRGVELETFDKATKSATQRSAMLDKYNSYSGNAASALGRPIELLVAVMAQLIVLRFLAASLVRPQLSWRIAFAAMALGGIVGFLINNGFNALNVQMIDIDTRPVIADSDLAAPTDANLRALHAAKTSNVTQFVPESQVRNPITNTVLRNLVLEREPKALPRCVKSSNNNLRFPDDVIDYGFPQRDWMKQMLPEALDVQRLRIVLNATDESINQNVTSDRLPMNATRAADLFLTSVLLSYTYIPWGKQALWQDRYNQTPNSTHPDGRPFVNPPSAIVAGLLPPNGSQATEAQQRDWFLRESRSFLTKRTIRTQNLSRSDVVLEFAHVDLSPTITFDAVTWEVELDPATLATTQTTSTGSNKTTRYTQLWEADCGPWPAVCMVPRQDFDTPVVIHAFAVCANADGSETLRSQPRGSTLYDYFIQCPTNANNSLLFFSATKRLVADALLENTTVTAATGLSPGQGTVITNLRKIYTFTVSRLGWTWQDLAEKYGADCQSAARNCTGLDFVLTGGKQHLVVGVDSVPLGRVNGPYYDSAFREVDQHPLPIVRIVEPPVTATVKARWEILAGDFLLRHNIGKNISWDMSRQGSGNNCEVVQEDRQQLVLNNHLYMETTLQSTYTAALFFLFQNGVVKDTLALSQRTSSLQFNGNIQNIAVRISIPNENAMLTYLGCLLLAGALLAAVLWSHFKTQDAGDPLRSIAAPHVIARVLLDAQTFPSLLLHRQIMSETANGKTVARPADDFLIDSIVLDHQGADASQTYDGVLVASASSGVDTQPRPLKSPTGYAAV